MADAYEDSDHDALLTEVATEAAAARTRDRAANCAMIVIEHAGWLYLGMQTTSDVAPGEVREMGRMIPGPVGTL